MPEHHKKPELEWRGAVPIARQFEDPYFSLNGGLEETRHVFLAGNALAERFAPDFHIAELGFGTGLNALAAWQLWRDTGQTEILRFTSFEQYPMAPDDMARALAVYPELQAYAGALIEGLAKGRVEASDFRLEVILGDARETLRQWEGQADAWFLDGFSPAKNPELWEPELLKEVAHHTAPNGTAATYSAAGHVRASLTEAGFTVERRPGFGRKRHMTVARK